MGAWGIRQNTVLVGIWKPRAAQLRYRLSMGDYRKGEDWVFIQDDGRRMHYGTLGYADATITTSIYAHGLKENDRKASDALENILRHA